MSIPVADVPEVRAARCLSCLKCVESCPATEEGAITWGPPTAFGRSWPQAALIAIMMLCVAGAVVAAYTLPIPSFVKVAEGRGEAPAQAATVELEIGKLACRGNAALFAYFVERDDEYEVAGYLRIEAWPSPDTARVRITYDPGQTGVTAIQEAITEPYYDAVANVWRFSPFEIMGYDSLGLFESDTDPDVSTEPD
jgi:ferredoxin